MAISDLTDDGTFEWLYRDGAASAAIERETRRCRVDVAFNDEHRAIPFTAGERSMSELAAVAFDRLTSELRRADRLDLLPNVERACAALAAA